MNTQEYIESGILELYTTGNLSEEERREVEEMVRRHPEIAQELKAIEDTLATFAASNKQLPRPELKAKVMQAVLESAAPATTKIIPLQQQKIFKGWQYAIAASITLLLISNIVFWYNWNSSEQKFSSLQNSYSHMNEELAMLRHPASMKIMLKGKDIAPTAHAMVHWNKESHHLMIDYIDLPQADAEHQYQLWALFDGQPIDAGVFDPSTNMVEMKEITEAQAFAVTLEPKGGSKSPTLEKMYLYASI